MSVPAPPAAEHHVAPGDSALVHLSQVHRGEVDLESSLVTKCLETHVALDSLLASGWVDKTSSQVIKHGIELSARLQWSPPWTSVLSLLSVRRILTTTQVHWVEQ